MESAEIRSEAAAATLDATVLTALTDQWERVGEVAARVEYWQRPTVRSALWRLNEGRARCRAALPPKRPRAPDADGVLLGVSAQKLAPLSGRQDNSDVGVSAT